MGKCECGRDGIHLCRLRIPETTPEQRAENLRALKSAVDSLVKLRDEHGIDLTDFSHWSSTLPPCSKCGCRGLHACIGRHLPPPTPEDEARLKKTLDEIFGQAAEGEETVA